jgi:hypothetical protein
LGNTFKKVPERNAGIQLLAAAMEQWYDISKFCLEKLLLLLLLLLHCIGDLEHHPQLGLVTLAWLMDLLEGQNIFLIRR